MHISNILLICFVRLISILFTSSFFFNDTATTEIYTLSLHDALPIFPSMQHPGDAHVLGVGRRACCDRREDRKSTRLNSSHVRISYAVFCLKKKKNNVEDRHMYDNEQI